MKRFVDLRGSNTGCRFAWWDTVVDRFEMHGDYQAWCSWEEFAFCYESNDLPRYRALTPAWADNPATYIRFVDGGVFRDASCSNCGAELEVSLEGGSGITISPCSECHNL